VVVRPDLQKLTFGIVGSAPSYYPANRIIALSAFEKVISHNGDGDTNEYVPLRTSLSGALQMLDLID